MIGSMKTLLALLCGLTAIPAAAAERAYTVTNFDRVRVEGPYTVRVTSGKAASAKATGSAAALDAVIVRVDGRTLIVRRDTNGWGGFPQADKGRVSIAVSVPVLVGASLAGSGALAIDAMRGARVDLAVDGSGQIQVGRITADMLNATVAGSAGLDMAGRAATARVDLRGSGAIRAGTLEANDAKVSSAGSGQLVLTVKRAANIQFVGSGVVEILGTPACTVRNIGSGDVVCGKTR